MKHNGITYTIKPKGKTFAATVKTPKPKSAEFDSEGEALAWVKRTSDAYILTVCLTEAEIPF